MVAHPLLAINATDAGNSTFPIDRLYGFVRRINLVISEDGTNIRISRVDATFSSGVRHHRLDFLPDLLRRIGQRNIVAVALAHLAPIQPRQPGNWRQERLRLGKYFAVV